MNIDQLIPILDSLSKIAETMPFHYVALAGFVLAGVVVFLRKWRGQPDAGPAEAVLAPAKTVADAPADAKAQATVTDIASKTLDPK